MRIVLLAVVILCTSHLMQAQNKGSITPETLGQIQKAYQAMNPDQAMINALTQNDLKALCLNQLNTYGRDTYFSNRVKSGGVTDQKSSGRCWLFASLNVFRPMVIEKYNLGNFQFSQNYLFFYDQLEKANLFLQAIISTSDKPMEDRQVEWLFKNPIGDGGVWGGFVNLVDKYGLVPSTVMPETNSSNKTSQMSAVLTTLLRKDALILRKAMLQKKSGEEIQNLKTQMLAEVYKVLVYNLGEPPTKFDYRFVDKAGIAGEYKQYTPLSFYHEVLSVNMGDYVLFMNDPTREYYKLYEIEWDRNTWEGVNWKYINLPAEVIRGMAIESIKGNEAMYFSCDVGKQIEKIGGTLDIENYDYNAIYNLSFDMDKAERIQTFESSSSHGMTLVGVDLDASGQSTKWLLENSWGNIGFEGHLIMTNEWFDEYMFRLVINKKYVPAAVLDILKQKPIMLPPWDPMFREDQ